MRSSVVRVTASMYRNAATSVAKILERVPGADLFIGPPVRFELVTKAAADLRFVLPRVALVIQ